MRWRAWLAETDPGWLVFAAMIYTSIPLVCLVSWLLVSFDAHSGWALLGISFALVAGAAAGGGASRLSERSVRYLADAARRGDPRLTRLPTRTRKAFREIEEASECTGWKIAAVLAVPDAEGGASFVLEGVAGGRYRAAAEAECLLGRDHDAPFPECSCGFHAWHNLPLALRYESTICVRGWVLLQVELGGEILVYEHGVRAAAQDVLGVVVPHCDCGAVAAGVELRSLPSHCTPSCATCVEGELVSFSRLGSALGVEVGPLS